MGHCKCGTVNDKGERLIDFRCLNNVHGPGNTETRALSLFSPVTRETINNVICLQVEAVFTRRACKKVYTVATILANQSYLPCKISPGGSLTQRMVGS